MVRIVVIIVLPIEIAIVVVTMVVVIMFPAAREASSLQKCGSPRRVKIDLNSLSGDDGVIPSQQVFGR